jgi:hypothetical protein
VRSDSFHRHCENVEKTRPPNAVSGKITRVFPLPLIGFRLNTQFEEFGTALEKQKCTSLEKQKIMRGMEMGLSSEKIPRDRRGEKLGLTLRACHEKRFLELVKGSAGVDAQFK